MTDTADQIKRLHGVGVNNELVEFAKGGIVSPGFEPPALTRCLQETSRYIEENYGPGSERAAGSYGDGASISATALSGFTFPSTVTVVLPPMPIRAYGEIVLASHYDDEGARTSVTVERADDIIGVSTEALHMFDLSTFNEDGYLVADTAGEYVYRPIRFAEQGRVVVCERVR